MCGIIVWYICIYYNLRHRFVRKWEYFNKYFCKVINNGNKYRVRALLCPGDPSTVTPSPLSCLVSFTNKHTNENL